MLNSPTRSNGLSPDHRLPSQASERGSHKFPPRLLISIYAPLLLLGVVALQQLHWQGSQDLHTIMEVVATLLATFVGILAFVRFYSKKESTYLFLASGFIGTAMLDGFHAIVTSGLFSFAMPSPSESLIPWSWNASRTFLALLMVVAWLASEWERKRGQTGRIPEKYVFAGVGGLTLLCFGFFTFYPMPRAYYPEFFFSRPEEFIAALFLAIALYGFISRGDQRLDTFNSWLVGSLVVGLVCQTVVMSRSLSLFDLPFDLAHVLKIASYALVLVGLLIEFHRLFYRLEEARASLQVMSCDLFEQTAQANSLTVEACASALEAEVSSRKQKKQELRTQAILKEMHDAVATINEKGIVEEFNVAAERMFGYSASEVLGKNISMLMPAPYRNEHDGYLSKYMATNINHVIGIGRDVSGLRKDGTEFPAHLAVSEVTVPIFDSENSLRLFTGIIRDLTEQKEAEANLLFSKQKAEAANLAKSEFLANMSHEIRTPMTAILGYLDLLFEEGGLSRAPLSRIDMIHTIRANANHLLMIINDILDMSKIEVGRMSVEQIETRPSEIIEEVVSLMKSRADGKGIDLLVEYEGLIPERITSDPTRLRQIIVNLVGNAIKFTEVGAVCIRISMVSKGDAQGQIQFAVSDTGIGMTEEQRDIIARFDAFSQADKSTTRKFGGSGLGLRISNSLAQILGGKIEVESKKGEGSTFTVSIDPGDLREVQMLTAAEIVTRAEQVATEKRTPNAVEKNKPLQDVRILLAEDGPDNQRLITFILKKVGAEIEIAENGRIAVEKIYTAIDQEEPFDLVLMDMQMPELDGYGATRQLRQEHYPGPIIALTAHAMAEDRQKCLDAGCDDYATKPLDRTKLIETIQRYTVAVKAMR